jgi:hypothetical protein
MSASSSNPTPVHERSARGEKAPRSSRRSGFSHSGPGYHDVPGPSKRLPEKGKQSIRAHKRKIRRKEEG